MCLKRSKCTAKCFVVDWIICLSSLQLRGIITKVRLRATCTYTQRRRSILRRYGDFPSCLKNCRVFIRITADVVKRNKNSRSQRPIVLFPWSGEFSTIPRENNFARRKSNDGEIRESRFRAFCYRRHRDRNSPTVITRKIPLTQAPRALLRGIRRKLSHGQIHPSERAGRSIRDIFSRFRRLKRGI